MNLAGKIALALYIVLWAFLLSMATGSTANSADDVVTQTLCDLNDSNQGCIFTQYKVGDTDTLVAEAEPGYYFVGWGGICSGRGDCTFTITKEGQRLDLTARFEKIPDKPKNLRRVR